MDFSRIVYGYIDYGLLIAFIERWLTKTSSFHLPIGEMTITLYDVSYLLHISIRWRFLDHFKVTRPEALELKVTQLGVDSSKA